jgi:hypothetical protein
MLTFADGEFCLKKSTIPSGMGCGVKPGSIAFLNFAASLVIWLPLSVVFSLTSSYTKNGA